MTLHSMVWQEAVSRIRQEHENLHLSTARFLAEVRQGQGLAFVLATLRQLTEHLQSHFETEEQLMRRAAFPGLHTHRLLHQACLNQFRMEQDFLGLGQPRQLADYEEMIHTWVDEHMRIHDRRFEEFIGAGIFTQLAQDPPCASTQNDVL